VHRLETAALDRALPAELVGSGARWFGYRRYPAFSWPWLWRRWIPFALVIGAIAAMSTAGSASALGDWGLALLGGAHFFAGAMVVTQAGAALATWVRHRHWAGSRQRAGVAIALLLGIGLSFLADAWASGFIQREISSRLEQGGRVTVVLRREEPPKPLRVQLSQGLFLALVYGALGGALALPGYWSEPRRLDELRRQRDLEALRRGAQEADLRLAVLQAQVEPHFLFNSLASLRALIRTDPVRAEAALDALVAHLRATIPQLRAEGAQVDASLGGQVDVCSSYLDLMRIRMGERLRVEVAVPAALRARDFPPLLLVSLVENAIKHGIEPKRGPGLVRIEAEEEDGMLSVRVIDSGAGLAPGVGGGVGLANVREQLALRFAGRAALSLRSRPEGGVLAEIRIPTGIET
jgi:hypothetical protein